MRYIKLLMASVMLVSMSACVADNESDLEGYIKTINFVGPDEIAFEQTKATFVENGSALVFKWAAGDTLGIFPNKGNQVEFPITTQESSTSASFDGGGWALRNNASYAAYYPFSVWNYLQNNKTIVLDYSGQVQDGNGSFAHLSAYDYLASAKTTPENGSVTFQMDRQGSILYIDIVVPEPATITSLTISCDEAIFVEKAALDISGNNPVVTPIETKESLSLAFENTATTEQNEIVRAYMAVQPVDFSSKTVTATLRTSAGIYSAPVVSRVVNKGKAAFLRFSDSFTENTIPEAVDLGLPPGIKWAACNLGASTPEEYGDYYAWGETEPYYEGYDWASYKFRTSGDSYDNVQFSKYNAYSSFGSVDNKTVLDLEDDAAHEILGGKWRIPSAKEWYELRDECTWTWTIQNGVNGYLITGTNGNSLFIPAAGYWGQNLFRIGIIAACWSSSFGHPLISIALFASDGNIHVSASADRVCGLPVRPVSDEGVRVSVSNVTLDKNSLILPKGVRIQISATITPTNATQPSVIWSSSNCSVADVDFSGIVTTVAAGTTTITATTYDGGFTATCDVNVEEAPSSDVHEAVDLGLTSGLKWATCNLGANVPEQFGDYYAWGDTEPYYEDGYAQSYDPVWKEGKSAGYFWASYKFRTSGDYQSPLIFSKYNTRTDYGPIDNKIVLDPEDDAAAVTWGDTWRMPTDEEWTELREECSWTWTTRNGINGYLVTGYNGNSIFLPAAGYRDDYNNGSYYHRPGMYLRNACFAGYYWSSSLGKYPISAWEVYFDDYHRASQSWIDRCYGLSVRPVYGDMPILLESISLDKTELELGAGESYQLFLSYIPDNCTFKKVAWSSDNEYVATVSPSGEVKGIHPGTATITVIDPHDKNATCKVIVKGGEPAEAVPAEAVDLGLPSGVKWASYNLGATAPEEYGDYYAWGETKPYYTEGHSQYSPCSNWIDGKEDGYLWTSYKFRTSGDSNVQFSKYNISNRYGTVDNKTVLEPEDDAAYVNWGGSWRMPTAEEYDELLKKCTWTGTIMNGVNGYAVTGPNGNSIFLPAAGVRYDANLGGAGSGGDYWSSSLATDYPYSAIYMSSGSTRSGNYRYFGLSVRPVTDEGVRVSVTGITLDKSSLELGVGGTAKITATVSPSNATQNSVIWSSSDTSVATVSWEGVVTAVGPGTATITATTYDGGYTAKSIIQIASLLIGGYNYKIKKMEDGRWWMVENLHYAPEGVTIGDGQCGIWYPCSDTALEFDSSEECVISKGLLYSDTFAFDRPITSTTALRLEGAQGVCPAGWHIPTLEEYMALVGKSTNTELEVNTDAPYYDADRNHGSLSMLEEAGFNTTMSGYVDGKGKGFEENGDIKGYLASRGYITTSYLFCSTAYSRAIWYALVLNKTANTADVGMMSNFTTTRPFAGSLRCIKDE